jgi:hypothetical protein
MLVPILYAGLDTGHKRLQRPDHVPHGRLVWNRFSGEKPCVDGLLDLGEAQVCILRVVELLF